MDVLKVIVILIDKVLFLYLPNLLFPIFSKNLWRSDACIIQTLLF